jgi:UTP:GlnB (protein PII) uridylyltransferase
MTRRTSPEFIAAFVESLPPDYRNKFDADVVAAHASVAAARGDALASAGLFGRAGNGLCIVAEDRPGLLALISASLFLSRLDVSAAEVYTRDVSGRGREAVDLFTVRKVDAPTGSELEQVDADRVRDTLTRLMRGVGDPRAEVDKLMSQQSAAAGPKPSEATVRFIADDAGGLSTLEVETSDRTGLLFSLASALYANRVQIVQSNVSTVDGKVLDRFRVFEFDGSPIDAARRLEIQVAVLNAMEPASRTVPPPSRP